MKIFIVDDFTLISMLMIHILEKKVEKKMMISKSHRRRLDMIYPTPHVFTTTKHGLTNEESTRT